MMIKKRAQQIHSMMKPSLIKTFHQKERKLRRRERKNLQTIDCAVFPALRGKGAIIAKVWGFKVRIQVNLNLVQSISKTLLVF
jgi:hypothetical protein